MSKSKDEPMSNEMFSPLPASTWDVATTSMDHWAICGICGEHVPEGMPRLVAPNGAECHRSCYLSARSSERVDERQARMIEVCGNVIALSEIIMVSPIKNERFVIHLGGEIAIFAEIEGDIEATEQERAKLVNALLRESEKPLAKDFGA